MRLSFVRLTILISFFFLLYLSFPPRISAQVCSVFDIQEAGAGSQLCYANPCGTIPNAAQNADCSPMGPPCYFGGCPRFTGATCCLASGLGSCQPNNIFAACGIGANPPFSGFRCCSAAIPTPTPIPPTPIPPTPIPPTPTPGPCSSSNCLACISGPTCGWNGSSCENRPGQNTCPAGYSQWYWSNCGNNVCAPTPTPIPPTPTPFGGGPLPPTPTPIPPTPTPTPDTGGGGGGNCGNYDTPNGTPSCNGGWMCNHCGQCILVGASTCEPAGNVCVNRFIPLGGFPTTCTSLDIKGIVFVDTNLDGIPNGAETSYTGNYTLVTTCCDTYGNPITTITGTGGATITVQDAVLVCDVSGTDNYGNPICTSSHYDPGAIIGNSTNNSNGEYIVSPLNANMGPEYIVTITPPLGTSGTGAIIRSFRQYCPSPTSLPCFTPQESFSNGFDRVLSPTSVLVRIPPSGGLPSTWSWTTVDFGISPLTPTLTPTPIPPTPTPVPLPPAWFQSTGLNIRIDAGFDAQLPAGQFSSIPAAGGTPGIIFGGKSTPTFGLGEANALNWKLGNFALWKQDIYVNSHNAVPSSYDFLASIAQSSGIALTNLGSSCDIDNCTLPAGFSNGIYQAKDNLVLNSYTFTGNRDYIILVNGNLTIKGPIIVTPGSTVIFSAKNNVSIDKAVVRIEGLYSADRDLIAGGTVSGGDAQLTIAGTAIANASLLGGSFVNNRNLGAANATTPSVKFVERSDFIVNYPDFVKQEKRVWQEVAP